MWWLTEPPPYYLGAAPPDPPAPPEPPLPPPAPGEERPVYLRITEFRPPEPPITKVIPAAEAEPDVHVVANQIRKDQGWNVDVEIFEWPGDLASAKAEGERRGRGPRIRQRERYLDTTHDWAIAFLYYTAADGVVWAPDPAPIRGESIATIFQYIVKHPFYKNQTVLLQGKDGSLATIQKGRVELLEKPREVRRFLEKMAKKVEKKGGTTMFEAPEIDPSKFLHRR